MEKVQIKKRLVEKKSFDVAPQGKGGAAWDLPEILLEYLSEAVSPTNKTKYLKSIPTLKPKT